MKYQVVTHLKDFERYLRLVHVTLHAVDRRALENRVYISKFEKRDNYCFIALEQPDYNKQKQQFEVKEVYFILHPQLLLVYDAYQSRYVSQFFEEVEQSQFKNASPAMLLLGMLDFYSHQIDRAIPKFNSEVSELQNAVLDQADIRDLIFKVQLTKRNLITFNSILEPIKNLNISLSHLEDFSQSTQAKELLGDYTERIDQVIKSIQYFEKQMDVLSEANEAQMQRRTNKNLGTLTVVNSLLLLPPIIYDWWDFFMHKSPQPKDYWFLVIGIFIFAILVLYYLKHKKLI